MIIKVNDPDGLTMQQKAKLSGLGSRKTRPPKFTDIQMVLQSLEMEAKMGKKQRREVLLARFKALTDAGFKGFKWRAETKMTMGSWRLLLVIAFPLYTAFRRSDCCNIRWCDIMMFDHEGNAVVRDSVVRKEQKTKNRREVPINTDLAFYIAKAYAEIKPKNLNMYVFIPKINRSDDDIEVANHITVTGYAKLIRYAFARFGVYDRDGYVAPHSLRKAYAQYLFEEFGSNYMAMVKVNQALGHSSLEMTIRYLDIQLEELRDAQQKISFRGPELRPGRRIG